MQPMDACVAVWMVTPAPTVPFHQLAAVRNIATGMLLWTLTVRTAACAVVPMDGLATAARSLRPVMPNSIVLATEAQLTLMQLTDARAIVCTNSLGRIAPFHQLAKVCVIATDTPHWIKTVRMAAYATVPIHGPGTVAR